MSDNGNEKRAVLYARTSYDDRDTDGRNLAGQLEMGRKYAEKRGYIVVAEIAEDDKGASGAAFELPGLDRVREMAAAGNFDVLVPRELDRLSRNLAKQLVVEEELKRAGVDIEYVLGEYPDTPEGRLQKHIKATIAEYEREKITERLVRGRENKVKAGSVLVYGMAPYGYREIKDGTRSQLTIYEPEARIVRLVFTWYVYGDAGSSPLSLRGIASRLQGTPSYADIHSRPKKGELGHWSSSSVRQMLRTETYAGTWHYGKRRRGPDGKWIHSKIDDCLGTEVPAIVDRETWEAAQLRLARNRQAGHNTPKYDYLLSGRVTCGTCGLKMAGSLHHSNYGRLHYPYYHCPAASSARDYARVCNALHVPADLVDVAVWGWVRSFLTDPEALMRGLGQYQAERERENTPLRERLQVVDDLLADNRAQLTRLLDLYLAGDFSREILAERKARLETTIRALERERGGLAAQLEARTLTPGQIQALHDFATRAAKGLTRAEVEFAERRGLIEDLDVRAVLVVEEGQQVAHVSCIIGNATCALRPARSLV